MVRGKTPANLIHGWFGALRGRIFLFPSVWVSLWSPDGGFWSPLSPVGVDYPAAAWVILLALLALLFLYFRDR
ncbi:hypothetical protein LCGC14_3096920 [marine sediment metagenome]|uniref:Uncharacterized protein n=1 Tax=marine sediment metagenome TaxID=412755 RepID=A0A0F8W8T2_9ZZZZ